MAKQKSNKSSNGANIGYEAALWRMADALRGGMDAAEYKHVVLGLIFLKYISDAFEEQQAKLEVEKAQGADPEDPDEYRALNILWIPPEARWSHLKPRRSSRPSISLSTMAYRASNAIMLLSKRSLAESFVHHFAWRNGT
jgi:type I restriction enzyme M protein